MRFLVLALAAEARPVVAHFGLVSDGDAGPFRVYRGPDLGLVVSGVGKAASSAATAFLWAELGRLRDRPWINVGLAGHRSLEIGESVVAHKIDDRAAGRSWYPPQVFAPPRATSTVVTVDRVEETYGQEAAFDMEAAGFYPTASRFSTAELVQVFKVVSDNPFSPVGGLTPAMAAGLIEENLAGLELLLEATTALAAELAAARFEDKEPPGLAALVERHHFTVTQERRLRRLLERLRVMGGEGCGELLDSLLTLGDRRRVLSELEAHLAASPLVLP